MLFVKGYVIYPSAADTNAISSAGNAQNAWENALRKIAKFNVVTNAWEKSVDKV